MLGRTFGSTVTWSNSGANLASCDSMDIQLDAPVVSADGADLGKIDKVIFDPQTSETKSIVVRKGTILARDVAIPTEHVRVAAATRVELDMTKAQVEALPDFVEAVRHAEHPDALAATTRTRAIIRTLAATLFPDLKRAITTNDALDFLHAAVPITYCDGVLLDGGTADLVERAQRKLKGVRMAMVFSGRRGGVERFLDYLETKPSI